MTRKSGSSSFAAGAGTGAAGGMGLGAFGTMLLDRGDDLGLLVFAVLTLAGLFFAWLTTRTSREDT